VQKQTVTELRVRYVELSWDYEFPEYVEEALEADFILHPSLYDDFSMKKVATLLLINPIPDPSEVLNFARNDLPA